MLPRNVQLSRNGPGCTTTWAISSPKLPFRGHEHEEVDCCGW